MNTLATALGPVFATGFAVQQLLELLDPVLSAIANTPVNKKIVMGIISLILGLLLAKFGQFHVLADLSTASGGQWHHPALDFFVTGLILSAGTEGFNSIMKFIGYAKENKKAEAATEKSSAPPAALKSLNRGAGA
jgi:uncharacterized protein YacL